MGSPVGETFYFKSPNFSSAILKSMRREAQTWDDFFIVAPMPLPPVYTVNMVIRIGKSVKITVKDRHCVQLTVRRMLNFVFGMYADSEGEPYEVVPEFCRIKEPGMGVYGLKNYSRLRDKVVELEGKYGKTARVTEFEARMQNGIFPFEEEREHVRLIEEERARLAAEAEEEEEDDDDA